MLDLDRIAEAVRYEGRVSRRLFTAYAAALAGLPLLAGRTSAADKQVSFTKNPFTLGVASGDPAATSVALWTRLAPEPLEADGGLSRDSIAVGWEVAADEGFKEIITFGSANAAAKLGHSVHVVAEGLKPDHWYYYRFHAGDAVSPIGRTRTLPAPDSSPEKLRFAFASCQHWEQGLFTAYEQMAKDDVDLVFHLGDYIYEYAGKDNPPDKTLYVRKHAGLEIKSLGDYRVRHAQYKTDDLLQKMHAACPWFVTWDDHEVDNNYANSISEEAKVTPAELLARRTNAYQAYYEAMPLRPQSLPKGPDMLLYRKAAFGKLAEFFVLDERQYRTNQPNNDKPSVLNEAALNPENTLLGATQREWLQQSLTASQGTWNILAQQVMMGLVSFVRQPGPELKHSMDQWPGYAHERMELVKFLAERKIANPVVLTGDIHSNWANELRVDDRKLDEPTVATEFVATSISSGGNGLADFKELPEIMGNNPFVKFHNRERGYVRCTVTPKQWTSDFVVVDEVMKPGGKSTTRASFVVEAGKAVVQRG